MVMLDAVAPTGAERLPLALRRTAGVALVILLHLVALFLLMTSTVIRTAPTFVARETELILLPKPRAKKLPRPRLPATHAPALSPRLPSYAPPVSPDMRGLGRSLFGCLGHSDCTNAPLSIAPGAMEGSPLAPHSLVLDETHWQAELARERAPVRVPCSYTEKLPDQSVAFMVDMKCLLKAMLGGFGAVE